MKPLTASAATPERPVNAAGTVTADAAAGTPPALTVSTTIWFGVVKVAPVRPTAPTRYEPSLRCATVIPARLKLALTVLGSGIVTCPPVPNPARGFPEESSASTPMSRRIGDVFEVGTNPAMIRPPSDVWATAEAPSKNVPSWAVTSPSPVAERGIERSRMRERGPVGKHK